MPAPRKYPDELRERAVRLVRDRIADEPGLPVYRTCRLVGEQLGINGDTLRNWVRSERVDAGEVAGRTSDDAIRMGLLSARLGWRPVLYGDETSAVRTLGSARLVRASMNTVVVSCPQARGSSKYTRGHGLTVD